MRVSITKTHQDLQKKRKEKTKRNILKKNSKHEIKYQILIIIQHHESYDELITDFKTPSNEEWQPPNTTTFLQKNAYCTSNSVL